MPSTEVDRHALIPIGNSAGGTFAADLRLRVSPVAGFQHTSSLRSLSPLMGKLSPIEMQGIGGHSPGLASAHLRGSVPGGNDSPDCKRVCDNCIRYVGTYVRLTLGESAWSDVIFRKKVKCTMQASQSLS